MGLGLLPFLRGFVKWVFAYALILLFSRPVIDVIIVQGMKLASIIPASIGIVGKATAFLPFLVLGVVVVVAELCFLLIPIFGLSKIENKIKYVTVG